LTRDELTERVLDHSFASLGLCWKRATAARRVREALEILLQGEEPVISAGHGYKLASRATPAERERAAQLAERQATRLFAKARKIRAVTLPGEPVERRLFPRVMV
jgi:thiamine pyrophosphate-dependent acetolactate synthase large subunit-like protein